MRHVTPPTLQRRVRVVARVDRQPQSARAMMDSDGLGPPGGRGMMRLHLCLRGSGLCQAVTTCGGFVDGSRACRRSAFVTCSKLGSGRAVLIGDAAHAMPPTIGMGCNLALLDCTALTDAAVATGGNLDAVAERFTREHLPDVRAVSRLARRMCDFQFARFHGSRYRAMQGRFVALSFALAGPTQRLPGVPRRACPPCMQLTHAGSRLCTAMGGVDADLRSTPPTGTSAAAAVPKAQQMHSCISLVVHQAPMHALCSNACIRHSGLLASPEVAGRRHWRRCRDGRDGGLVHPGSPA